MSLFACLMEESVRLLDMPWLPMFASPLTTPPIQCNGNNIGTDFKIPPVASRTWRGGLAAMSLFSWSRKLRNDSLGSWWFLRMGAYARMKGESEDEVMAGIAIGLWLV